MSFEEKINAYFVTTSASSKNENLQRDLAEALKYLRNHVSDDDIRHIKASEGYPLIASGRLTKTDVFIFDRFEGDFFKQIQSTKSLIVGARCLITCLLKCEKIPLGKNPVYTTAMRDLNISATGITPQTKERLRQLIEWMGGNYMQNFSRAVTHLVSNTIKSTKYETATLNGIPVMHVDWVQRVWDRSCVQDVLATDDEFNKYRLPIFFGTNITCTGLETTQKNEVMRMVNENGGTYHRAFRSQQVDIVITEKSKTNSEKYQAAIRYKKDVLLPGWIFDSVEKGFALPTKNYQIKNLKVSTPMKNDQSIADFTSTNQTQLSEISSIAHANSKRKSDLTTVNETMCSINESISRGNFVAPAPIVASTSKNLQRELFKKNKTESQYHLIYDDICPKEAKKAGNFLDGCCIYLSGFRLNEREKLNRILNVGGATRYDVINEKITHIIVGQLDDQEFKTWQNDGVLKTAYLVELGWLLDSIKLRQTANENVYRVLLPSSGEPDAPSPSSKRTLHSMNHSFKQPERPIRKNLFESQFDKLVPAEGNEMELGAPLGSSTELPTQEEEHCLIAQYSQENVSSAMPLPPLAAHIGNTKETKTSPVLNVANNAPSATITRQQNAGESTEAGLSTIDFDDLDFFRGVLVYVDKEHFSEEFYTQMIQECEAAQGNVVPATFKDMVEYAIVSFERTLDVACLPVKARHIITELYVETCMKENKLVPIEYYHKFIPSTAKSLPLMGMVIVISIYTGLERDFIHSLAELMGARVNKMFAKKERPLLVCPSAEGSKYEGAIKWRYPVVTSQWLVCCAEQGVKLSYQKYLVGDSPQQFPVSPTVPERNTNELPNAMCELPMPMDVDAIENNNTPTAATDDFTPVRNKRVLELAGALKGARDSFRSASTSPQTPVNSNTYRSINFELMDKIMADIDDAEQRECLRGVLMEMYNNQTPELERIRRQACTPIKVPTPKGIPDFCTTPEFQKRMADEFERRWHLPTKRLKPDTPIDEIRKRVLRATCKAMGLSYDDKDEEASTTTPTTTARPDRQAAQAVEAISAAARTPLQNSNKTLTAQSRQSTPRPLSTYAKANTSVPQNLLEHFVPDTQSPNQSLRLQAMNISGLGQHATLLGKSTINFDQISFEESELGAASNGNVSAGPSVMAQNSPEMKQITDYLKNCESRRLSSKRGAINGGEAKPMSSLGLDTQPHYAQPFESEKFGGCTEEMVGWRDPVEFGMDRTKTVPAMQYKGTPRFSISCSSDEARELAISKILQLGGQISSNLVNFDPECTHFLCEHPNRGEKMLGCISAGKWVLSLKYIDECHAKDLFIDEELYEWGNTKAINMPELTPDEQVIAYAAHRWRTDLSGDDDESNGPFKNVHALLHIPERNRDALKTVIKAGKGEIIDASSPYSEHNGAHNATHCFVDVKKTPLSKADYNFLRSHDVNVLTQFYINAYLMHGSDYNPAKYKITM